MSNTNNNLQTQTSNALHNAIMEAGGKDRPPMLAPGNYVQWKSKIKRYIDTKPNNELIYYCLQNPPYKFKWIEKTIPVAEGIDNDIYFTVDSCPNACEMWKAIERLKQDESINVQDLETNLYWEFGKFTSRDGESLESYYSRFYKMMNELNEVNKIIAERLARTANPLALVAQQHPVYHPQNHPTHYTHNSLTKSQQAATRNREKAIVNSSTPTYDQEPTMVTEDDEIRENQDNTPRINKGTGYDNHRVVNVAGARDNVGTPMVQQSGIQCYNCKEYGHVARECQKPKRAKDAAYHKEKMLLCKQEEAWFQLNAEQAEWRDDIDDEPKDQELEAHYMYMTHIQKVTPDVVDNSGPIFDAEPLQKVQNNNDNYNVFAIESEHLEQPESVNDTYLEEQGDTTITIDSLDMSTNGETVDQDDDDDDDDLAKECEIKDFKTKNKSLESSNNHFKEANNELSKTNQLMFKDLKKFQAELDRYHDVNYASKVEINCAKSKGDLIITVDLEISLCLKRGSGFADLRYFNSFEHEVDYLKSQLETQKTQFLNEIDRLFREYYYADHMNAILGVYTTLDEFTDLQCDYVDQVVKCERLEKELSKNSLAKTDFSKSKSVTINNVSNDFSKPVTAQILPQNVMSILKNTNAIALGMTKQPIAVPISTREPKRTINQSVATSHKKTVATEPIVKKPKNTTRKLYEHVSTVKFGNDQIAPILGYGDLVQGNITIKRVYYVKGLNHNLFSVGQFCYANLEVAFQKSTCYIRDLKGNDLLTAWLWHHRLSHLNFDSINLLSKNDIVIVLPKLKFVKDHLCSSCELGKAKRKSFHTKTTPSSKRRLQLLHMDLCGPMRVESINGKKYVLVIVDDYSRNTWTHFLRSKDETPEVLIDFLRLVQRGLHAQVRTVRTDRGTEFLNKTLHAYFSQEDIEHQTSVARTPEQNGVVERRNRTLVEAARTMLSAAKVPLDGENLDKMKEKGDACIFVGYSTQSRAYRVYNKRTRVIVKTIHVNFDELPQMALDHLSSDPVPQCLTTALEHDSLSLGSQSQENVPQAAETSSAVTTIDVPNQRQQQHTIPFTSINIAADTPPLNIQTTPETTSQAPTQVPTVTATENINQAETNKENAHVEKDDFINIFSTPVQERGETSSRHVDSSNMHTFYQRHPSEHRWTKDHPLEQVIGNPS
ncbi:retrovirus-related pol polyprotein from transposon TNT 1-94 [Tanacetum coccineum]